MPNYIVVDHRKESHLIETDSPARAIMQVPGGQMVRLALQSEVDAIKKAEERAEKK